MRAAQSGLEAGLRLSRCVVFGGSGFMGSRLVARLAEAGADVISFDATPCAPAAGVTSITGDITDAETLASVVTGADHLFCFAGGLGAARSFADPLSDLDTSARAQLLLLEVLRTRAPSASVVLAGSRLEYGPPLYLPVDESHPLMPGSPYASHKVLCSHYYDMYARIHDLQAVVLRLPNPYGPHAIGSPARLGFGILNLFVDLASRDKPIHLYGDGSQLRDFVHVDDVVSAALAASVRSEAKGRALNIGSGVGTSLRDAAHLVVELAGSGTVVSGVAWPPEAESVETGDFYFDIACAREILGWSPRVPLREGLVSLLAGREPLMTS